MRYLPFLVTASVVVVLAYLVLTAAAAIAAALRTGGRREENPDTDDAVVASHLTVPVSIVVPAGAAVSPRMNETIASLLGLAYPDFEVIVIVESPASGIEALARTWELQAREFFYRQTLETGAVRRIFRSQRDARLMVVEQASGARSDALNCGVNLARYRFVAVVPPDVAFDPTALLRLMGPALQDPAAVVAVSSQVERVHASGGDGDLEARLQRLDSLRVLMATRLFWTPRRHAVGPVDAAFLWRRDALVQANGFSRLAASPELDMMFRLQCGDGHEDRRVIRLATPFGQAATLDAADARRRAALEQRSALQMAFTWGASAWPAMRGSFLLFLRTEVLVPLLPWWLVAATVGGALAGWYGWATPLLTLVALALIGGCVNAVALLVRGAHPGAPGDAELRALLLVSPVEGLLRGPRQLMAALRALAPRGV